MEKLASMYKTRVTSKAKAYLSKEKIIALGLSALLMAILINDQIRLALLNW